MTLIVPAFSQHVKLYATEVYLPDCPGEAPDESMWIWQRYFPKAYNLPQAFGQFKSYFEGKTGKTTFKLNYDQEGKFLSIEDLVSETWAKEFLTIIFYGVRWEKMKETDRPNCVELHLTLCVEGNCMPGEEDEVYWDGVLPDQPVLDSGDDDVYHWGQPVGDTPQTEVGSQDIPGPNDFRMYEREPEWINREQVLGEVKYHEMAIEAEIEGKVVVRVLVNPRGEYEKHVRLKDPHPILTSALEKQIMKFKFAPAIAGGKPVYAWKTLGITFEIDPKKNAGIVK